MVVAIIGIVIAIAVPKFVVYRRMCVERVCRSNRNTVLGLYEVFLLNENIAGSSFNQFVIENFDEICPSGGVITCERGNVEYNLHEDVRKDHTDEPPDEGMPWI